MVEGDAFGAKNTLRLVPTGMFVNNVGKEDEEVSFAFFCQQSHFFLNHRKETRLHQGAKENIGKFFPPLEKQM